MSMSLPLFQLARCLAMTCSSQSYMHSRLLAQTSFLKLQKCLSLSTKSILHQKSHAHILVQKRGWNLLHLAQWTYFELIAHLDFCETISADTNFLRSLMPSSHLLSLSSSTSIIANLLSLTSTLRHGSFASGQSAQALRPSKSTPHFLLCKTTSESSVNS